MRIIKQNWKSALTTGLFAAGTVLAASTMSAFSANAHLVYVSNEKDDTVSIIDTKTMSVVNTIEVGERPRGIILSKDHKYLYICASDSDTVQVLDVATNTIIHDLPSGEDPEQFALHPNNKHLYIANEDDNITTVVDVESRKVLAQIDVGVEPEGMAVSPDGKLAVNTSETTNMVHWMDTKTFKVIDNTLVDQRPRHAEFNKDGTLLWASSEIGGTVSIILVHPDKAAMGGEKNDATTQEGLKKLRVVEAKTSNFNRKVIHKINFKIPGISKDRIQPVGIRLTSDGKYAFVALGPANHIAVVDAKTYEVINYILVGRRVWHMALTPEEDLMFTTNGISGDVSVIDIKKLKAIKSIKVGRYPWGAAILPTK